MNQDLKKEILIQAYRERAEVYNLIGEKAKAILDIDKGISLANEMKNKKNLADLLITLANFYLSMSKLEEIFQLSKNALDIYKKISDKKGISDAFHQIANFYYSLGKFKRSKKFFNKIGNKYYLEKVEKLWQELKLRSDQ